MEQFFKRFPIINYNNIPVVDISKTVIVQDNVLNNPYLFSEISLAEGIRSDQLAEQVYNDPYFEWLIFLSNQIIDPYDEWYMDTDQFNDFMAQKYGDNFLAVQKIKYYTNNWYNGEPLTPSAFDALTPNLTKYFEPVYDGSNDVIQYVRTQVDWEISTNHMISFNYNGVPVPNTFIDDEICSITYVTNTGNSVGNGQICFVSNTQLNLQHLSGGYVVPNEFNSTVIYGTQSNTTMTANSANQIINIVDSLSPDEDVFYDPVTYFDYENEKNEQKKIINILSNNYSSQVATQFNKLLG